MIAIDLPLKPSGKSINPLVNENLKFVPKKHIEASKHPTLSDSSDLNRPLSSVLLLLLLLLFIALASSAHRYWFVHTQNRLSLQYRNALHYFEVWFVCSLNFELVPNWLNWYWSYLACIQHYTYRLSRSRKAQAAQFMSVNKEAAEEGGQSVCVRENIVSQIFIHLFAILHHVWANEAR